MSLQAKQHYMNTQVLTASPGDLTLMLFNGAIKFMKQALVSMEKRDIEEKHFNFVKAQNIIDELQSTLNMSYEVSVNLAQLYDYIRFRLSESNTKMQAGPAQECIQLVTELRDTWMEALKHVKSGPKGTV